MHTWVYTCVRVGGGGGGGGDLNFKYGEGVGGKCAPSHAERKGFCKRCTETSFLAQIDFSSSRYVLCNGTVT